MTNNQFNLPIRDENLTAENGNTNLEGTVRLSLKDCLGIREFTFTKPLL